MIIQEGVLGAVLDVLRCILNDLAPFLVQRHVDDIDSSDPPTCQSINVTEVREAALSNPAAAEPPTIVEKRPAIPWHPMILPEPLEISRYFVEAFISALMSTAEVSFIGSPHFCSVAEKSGTAAPSSRAGVR